ncbi:ABC transporter permease [Virgibacillus doumboii]|uniref:ABC transporter permease n=1 Tax=Virgibacillus doumboii TaxID=2697503 RepID=UPI0013DEEA72|nr:ABC transporter permease [Virgibacillus doumboii]
MKRIITTRFMHWKKQGISLTFWLLFPLLATISITMLTNTLQEDSKVPGGLVLEEKSEPSSELVQEIESTPFVRVQMLTEDNALYYLKKHELDSVFVINEGFEENIREDNRNQLITGYQSDLSFAYSPVKEMILSYIQQETGRSKAVFTVKELEQQYSQNKGWTYNEIVTKSKEIQDDENLLETAFSFSGSPVSNKENKRMFSIWGLWAVFSILATLLLFDWVIRERHSKAIIRLAFTHVALKSYLLQNFIIYTILLFAVDLFTISLFYFIFGEWISVINLVIYRILINLTAFLLAHLFKNTFLYYTVSFGLTLFIIISSGAVLPSGMLTDVSWFDLFNPLLPLLKGEFFSLWTICIIFFAILWLFGKERYHA